jgi:hypothetical protein
MYFLADRHRDRPHSNSAVNGRYPRDAWKVRTGGRAQRHLHSLAARLMGSSRRWCGALRGRPTPSCLSGRLSVAANEGGSRSISLERPPTRPTATAAEARRPTFLMGRSMIGDADRGGEFDGVGPRTWLADLLARIADHAFKAIADGLCRHVADDSVSTTSRFREVQSVSASSWACWQRPSP